METFPLQGILFARKSNTTSKFAVSLARDAFMVLLLLAPCAFAQTKVTLQNGTNCMDRSRRWWRGGKML